MITIEFQFTSDEDLKGSYTTYKRKITLGHSSRCDLPIEDSQLIDEHLVLQTSKEGLICSSIGQGKYLVNGKSIVGTLLLKKGDQVSLGSSSFNIVDFQDVEVENTSEFMKDKYKELVTSEPDLADVFDVIKFELIEAERSKDV